MKCPDVATVDFETQAIMPRPAYPPRAVGVAVEWEGKKNYYAWGHKQGNNCDKSTPYRLLKDLRKRKVPMLFHHAKFDLDVMEQEFDLPLPPWEQFHDTLFLAFLLDPHAQTHSLKPFAEKHLGIKPTERDMLEAWITKNVKPRFEKWKPSQWGAFICEAPGDLVGKYAVGDITRTTKLFKYAWKKVINELGMLEAYNRERRLLPHLIRNERRGIQADLKRLEADDVVYTKALAQSDQYIRKMLKSPDLNIDANDDLADAIEEAGFAEGEWLYTPPSKRFPAGQRSTSKESISVVVQDVRLARALRYRAALATCLGTFLQPWLASAREGGGILYPDWNQVRQAKTDNDEKGTRTGRLSVSRYMNVPKEFLDVNDEPLLPPVKSMPSLPAMRSYLTPRSRMRWGKRDYNQQELRILAHFEDGGMLREYIADPFIDRHDAAKARILEATGVEWPRRDVKITNFGIIYGMGLGKLAGKIQRPVPEAAALLKGIKSGYPDLEQLIKGLKAMGRDGEPIVTWGGRRYFCEEPKVVEGRLRSFEYKLLNYLIQGSAADCTKEAIIRFCDELLGHEDECNFLVTVHDEVNMESVKGKFKHYMELMRQCMEDIEFDVRMLSDGEYSDVSWHDLQDYTERRAA